MNEHIQRARELLNQLEDFEVDCEVEHAQRDPDEPDALLAWSAGMPRREPIAARLIYKTFQQPESTTDWNKWADTRIRKHIEVVVKIFVEEIRRLRAEIEALRAEVAATKVTHLRGRDAA